MKDVMAEFNPNEKSVKRLVRKINQLYRNSANYLQLILNTSQSRLSKVSDDLEFRRQCLKVLEFFEAKVSTFNKGESYYAAIIWIAAKMNVNTSIKDKLLEEGSSLGGLFGDRPKKCLAWLVLKMPVK